MTVPHFVVLTTIFTHKGPLFTYIPSFFTQWIGGDVEHFWFQKKHRLGQDVAVLYVEQEGGGSGKGVKGAVVPPIIFFSCVRVAP